MKPIKEIKEEVKKLKVFCTCNALVYDENNPGVPKETTIVDGKDRIIINILNDILDYLEEKNS